eukprot:jgi/Bigna1/76553/fgenesh1_pg.42_\
MSDAESEEALRRKESMRLFLADTGRSFPIQADPTDTIASLHERLELETGIPIKSQILLTAQGSTFDSKARVADYPKLTKNPDVPVFLFNRTFILEPPAQSSEGSSSDSKQGGPILFDASLVSASCFRIYEFSFENKSPLDVTHVLGEYQRHFENQLRQARAYIESHGKRHEASCTILRALDAKNHALRAAYNSLNAHLDSVLKSMSKFDQSFTRLSEENDGLLGGFETDLVRLGKIRVEPALFATATALGPLSSSARSSSSNKPRTLLDILPEARLRDWARNCSMRQQQLKEAVGGLRTSFERLMRDVKDHGSNHFHGILTKLEEKVTSSGKLCVESENLTEILGDDVNWVKQVMSHTHHMDDLRIFTSKARDKDIEHCHKLSSVRDYYDAARRPLESLYECRKEHNSFFYQRLAAISELQTKIRSCKKKLSLYKEGSESLRRMCVELKKTKALPGVYKACVQETKRRYVFQKRFLSLVSSFEKKLIKVHEEETQARTDFAKGRWEYLTPEFFPFLRYPPPKVHINVKNVGEIPNLFGPEEQDDGDEKVQEGVDDHKDGGTEGKDGRDSESMQKQIERLTEALRIAERKLLEATSKMKEGDVKKITTAAAAAAAAVAAASSSSPPSSSNDDHNMTVSTIEAEHVTPVKVMAADISVIEERPNQQQLLAKQRESEERISRLVQAKEQLQEQNQNLRDKMLEMQVSLQEAQQNNAHLEVRVNQMHQDKRGREEEMEQMGTKVALLLEDNRQLRQREDREDMWKELASARISFRSFQLNDVALFYRRGGMGQSSSSPGNGSKRGASKEISSSSSNSSNSNSSSRRGGAQQHYVAFNQGCPHRYLAPECRSVLKSNPLFVLGKIVQVVSGVVGFIGSVGRDTRNSCANVCES